MTNIILRRIQTFGLCSSKFIVSGIKIGNICGMMFAVVQGHYVARNDWLQCFVLIRQVGECVLLLRGYIEYGFSSEISKDKDAKEACNIR